MEKKKGFGRWLSGAAISELQSQIVSHGLSVVLPFVVAGVTGVVGWATDVGLMWILVGMSVAFASLSAGAYYFSNFWFQQTPNHKLCHGAVTVVAVMADRDDGSKAISGFKLGVHLNSIAIFPLQFQMLEIRSIIAGRINQPGHKCSGPIDIPAMGFGYYNDDAVTTDKATPNEILHCDFKYRLTYGRSENLIYTLEGSYKVAIKVIDAAMPDFRFEVITA